MLVDGYKLNFCFHPWEFWRPYPFTLWYFGVQTFAYLIFLLY